MHYNNVLERHLWLRLSYHSQNIWGTRCTKEKAFCITDNTWHFGDNWTLNQEALPDYVLSPSVGVQHYPVQAVYSIPDLRTFHRHWTSNSLIRLTQSLVGNATADFLEKLGFWAFCLCPPNSSFWFCVWWWRTHNQIYEFPSLRMISPSGL